VPVRLPTWLGLGFVTVYTMGCRRPILAGRDDSSIIIAFHRGALTLLEEDEAKESAEQSQPAAAELCDSTLEHVSSNP
jgi:hypothetical protein